MLYTTSFVSPIGKLLLAEKNGALVGLWIEGQKYFLGIYSGAPMQDMETPLLTKTKRWLEAYFSGQKPHPHVLPLAPEGSPFRQAVWKILCMLPYGKVTTYGEVAHMLEMHLGVETVPARAVGGAVGHNPISIVIPCHRVIGKSGKLVGYAGGVENKRKLLTLEGIDLLHPMLYKSPFCK
jgi:methylated-DNA-[protein]-cysteine S-methyltransferase